MVMKCEWWCGAESVLDGRLPTRSEGPSGNLVKARDLRVAHQHEKLD